MATGRGGRGGQLLHSSRDVPSRAALRQPVAPARSPATTVTPQNEQLSRLLRTEKFDEVISVSPRARPVCPAEPCRVDKTAAPGHTANRTLDQARRGGPSDLRAIGARGEAGPAMARHWHVRGNRHVHIDSPLHPMRCSTCCRRDPCQ